jgi:LPS-assembly lipoprotein
MNCKYESRFPRQLLPALPYLLHPCSRAPACGGRRLRSTALNIARDPSGPASFARLPNQGQARKLLNGGLPAGQEALKAATARPWVAFGSTALLVLGLTLLFSGCGFQLRGKAQLPQEMSRTQLVIGDQYSMFARRVRVLLEQSGVQFVSSADATAVLEIPQNDVVTEVLTIGDNARVREYRISHTIRFRVLAKDGREIIPLQTIRQTREISFDEQQILAVSREQEYVKQSLAETLSRLLLNRLAGAGGQS